MSLTSGTRLGPYEIANLIGAGGMGEIYRAHDTRLGRDVAIKVLPEAFAQDADRLARFEREAKSIAALSHQNIIAIHDTGTHDGQVFVVTELLEGETLRTRIQQGPLPLRKATDIAMQIARGLAAAHDKGIVHRDLKPENVFVRNDGQVKILDFGLARSTVVSSDATETVAAVTDPGTVMGTVGYMAPEQMRGQPVDARTDLFALGTVLYEMLSGQRAFKGDTAADTMIAIVKEDPPEITALRPDIPPALQRIVRHCLEKNPVERFQSARDVAFALESATDSGATSIHEALSGVTAGTAPAPRSRLPLGIIIGAAVVIVIGLAWRAGVFQSSRSSDEAPPIVIGTSSQLTTDDGLEIDPAISPDGKMLAYAAGKAHQMRIFIRPVGGGRTIPLSDDRDAFEYQPRWSPDSTQILYLTPAGAFVASAIGGTSRKVAGGMLSAAAWSPSGKQFVVARDAALAIVELDGSGERALGTASDGLHSCDWSPQGRWIACVSGNRLSVVPGSTFGNIAPSAVVLAPAAGGAFIEVTKLDGLNQSPVWSPEGRQLYFISNRPGTRDIYVVDIADNGQPQSDPRRVSTGLGAQSIGFSAERLVYVAYTARANLWSLPIPASGSTDTSSARALTNGNQVIESLRVSKDGQWLLYDSTLHLNADIFRLPMAGGPAERLTTDPSHDFAPDLSPDGREVAYHSFRSGSRDIFISPTAGGPPQQVTATAAQESYPIWSPDGQSLAFLDQTVGTDASFVTRRTPSGQWEAPVRVAAGSRGRSAWTADGKALVYSRGGAIEMVDIDNQSTRIVYQPRAGSNDPAAESVVVAEDGLTLYFKSHDAGGRASFWAVPTSGGQPRKLVRFEDPSRASIRPDFAAGAGKFFFTLEDRQADIWMADISRRRHQ
jgi:Tol biopolymer transport system component